MLIDHIEALRAAMTQTCAGHPFTIDAIVVLPDHFLARRRGTARRT